MSSSSSDNDDIDSVEDDDVVALAQAIVAAVPKEPPPRTLILKPDRFGNVQASDGIFFAIKFECKEEFCQIVYRPTEASLSRFVFEEQPFKVEIAVKGRRDFEDDALWIEDQVGGKWSMNVEVASDARYSGNTERRHVLIYSFETAEAATIFKLFKQE